MTGGEESVGWGDDWAGRFISTHRVPQTSLGSAGGLRICPVQPPPSGCPGRPPALPELGKFWNDTLRMCMAKPVQPPFWAPWLQTTAMVRVILGVTGGADTLLG